MYSLLKFLMSIAACKMNVHKRCAQYVSNSCGINEKQIADILKDLGKLDIDRGSKKHKVSINSVLDYVCFLANCCFLS